jgi:hypothetical protein
VYEGKGEVELNGENYASDFRLAHRLLQKAKDAENGFDVTLTANLNGANKKTFDSQFLLTDKALRAYSKFCGEKCSLVDVSNNLKITGNTLIIKYTSVHIHDIVA